MTTIIRIFGYIATGAGTLLLLENHRTLSIYVAMGLWLAIIIIRLLIDEYSRTHTDLKVYGWIYYVFFFSYVLFGTIHVRHLDSNHVAVYSPLWQKIEEGDAIDTIKLRCGVECNYFDYDEAYEDFYFLKVKDSIHVYNRFSMVMSIQKDSYSIIQRLYYGVPVDLIKTDGKIYSLEGDLVDENWRPKIHDTTPIDNTNL